ncbi:MAG TPA: hypothetical protein VN325_37315 [Steroidobacteraceae bacterium]|nr:hypothetical protein [Steroidobacteraceae bacterium]
MIGSLSLRGYTEGIDHEPAADRYDVKVVKVVFQYEIRSFKDRERRKTQIAEPRGQEQTDAQDGKLLLLACRRERPDRTTHHRDARDSVADTQTVHRTVDGRFFDSWSPEVVVFIGRSAEI